MTDSQKSQTENRTAETTDGVRQDTSIVRRLGAWVLKLFGRNGESTWQESVEELIDDEEDIAEQIKPEERDLLMNLLRFGEVKAQDVMVLRADIIAIEEKSSLKDVVDIIRSTGHSRIPVYGNTLDEVVGMVHVRDVVSFWETDKLFDIAEVMRPLIFIPQSMPVLDLLSKMRSSRLHMAIVVDEYGGTDGLVTIEDLVEEIVGEIEDEHDISPALSLTILDDNSVEADARLQIEELENHFLVTLRDSEFDEDIETIGGLVSHLAGRVPHRNEQLTHPAGLIFDIIDADPRRVKRVRIVISAHKAL